MQSLHRRHPLVGNEKGLCTAYTPGGPQQVTVVSEPGLYKLIASDLAAILGFSQPTTAYARLAVDEKSYLARTEVGLSPGRDIVAISESALYKLIMRSDKPEAREFQDWVTRTVLPAIPTRSKAGLPPPTTSRPAAKAAR